MYRVYFDNIEQDVKDIININSVIALTIIREDGITSTEQILREKTEMELQFTGCAYDYICGKIATDRCSEIQFSIEDTDTGISFNGVINTTMCELKIAQRIGKTKIKDDSFSAYIRDFMSVDIQPFFISSKDCIPITTPLKTIEVNWNAANTTDTYDVRGYDALTLIRYLVDYFTNGTVDVISTYLTNNKVFLTTGIMLRRRELTNDDIYPEFNIDTIFQELRKKYRLYMGIERYPNGVAYLRIEEEDYFFADTPLLTISEVPINLVQSFDTQRNFNKVEIGSTDTEVDEGAITYPQLRYSAWNEESYTGCGDCTGDKDNSLKLVSDYIIDSNMIYECVNNPDDDYPHDDSIYMIEYSADKTITTLSAGSYYFNDGFRNEKVLNNWLSYSGKCIAVDRRAKYGFLAINGGEEAFGTFLNNDFIRFGIVDVCPSSVPYDYNLGCITEVYDKLGTLSLSNEPATTCNVGYKQSVFECAETGVYSFNARSKIKADIGTNVTDDLIDAELKISFVIYSDNTMTTEIYATDETTVNFVKVNENPDQVQSFDIDSGLLPVSINNVVVVRVRMESVTIVYGSRTYRFRFYNSSFELTYDSLLCESFKNDADSKPFLVEFDYPLCAEDYLLIKDNKSGYIEIAGNRYWIKELTYKQGLSQLKLMGNSSLC